MQTFARRLPTVPLPFIRTARTIINPLLVRHARPLAPSACTSFHRRLCVQSTRQQPQPQPQQTQASQGSQEQQHKQGEEGAPKSVRTWLYSCAAMVFGIVVVGGTTRLTNSGLSMVEWKPHQILPPMNQEEWEEEFAKYKQFPEFDKSALDFNN
jgi:hypothetical protein